MLLTLYKLKRQDQPRPCDERYVYKANDVTEKAKGQHFDMSEFSDDFDTVEISGHLGEMVEDRSDTKQRWGSSEVLEQQVVWIMFKRPFVPKGRPDLFGLFLSRLRRLSSS